MIRLERVPETRSVLVLDHRHYILLYSIWKQATCGEFDVVLDIGKVDRDSENNDMGLD